jgi:hypothetical protein
MKQKRLFLVMLVIITLSACATAPDSSQAVDLPTTTATASPTETPAPTPTPTETATPTLYPTPQGELLTSPLLRFALFVPAGFESITGIYRYQYSYAAAYQGEDYWEKTIVVLDMDVSEEPDLPLEIYLLLALENLDYFNAAVEDTSAAFDADSQFPGAKAVDFTGNTQGVPIQGQIIGFKPDDDHVLIGLAWFDVSADPEAWNNEGVNLFHYVMDELVLEK